ncbi:MAG: S8 family serine peptidase [Phycisphaerales bacterium]|nr:S8 family serine peptidase [Phycisphaerales bacterium]
MPYQPKSAVSTLLASLVFALPVSGALAIDRDDPVSNPASVRILEIANTQLALQPGDAEAFARVLDAPMRFSPIAGVQELSGTLIVRAKNEHVESALARITPLMTIKSRFVEEYVLTVPKGISEGQLAAMLMSTGEYEFAQPNWILWPASVPNDPFYSISWQHTKLQSEAAWDLNTGSSSVIIAIVDTGVDINQPDLQSAMVPGYNSIQGLTQAEGANLADVANHGTFVAGCAAAPGDNNIGVTGVGWNFSIMPVRVVTNSGAATTMSISDGARWAGMNGAKVVNISFTGVMNPSNIALGDDLKAMGALLVYASGNSNLNISPDRPGFVIVSSTDINDLKAGDSNHGDAINVAAPGVNVTSSRIGSSYGNSSGTSYAAGITSGVCAMIFSVNPLFSPDDVQDILYASVDDLGVPGRDSLFGFGRVNTLNAIIDAQNYTPRTPLPIAESFESASWMDLLSATSGSVSVINDPDAPSGPSVLIMNETDVVETAPLAGTAASTTVFSVSMRVKAQGIEPGETLEIQYRDAAGAWISAASTSAAGTNTDDYFLFGALLDSAFGYHGTSIRLIANGSDSSDTWMIDDLRIEPFGSETVPFVDSFESGTLSELLWDPAQTSASVQLSSSSLALWIDSAVGETIDIDVTPVTDDGGFINFFAMNITQGGTDSLLVEFRNFLGVWTPLDTIDAADLSTSPAGFSYPIPLFALTDTFRLRFSDTIASGGFFIDDLSIGLDPLVLGCSSADLAEPLGTLNLQDVFAFLALFNAQDPAADLASPFGTFNLQDVFAYLGEFNNGCP